ncbi:Ecdysteroid kinase-domain-containing protein, partial [Protomyces lactucae-debilis]
ETIATLWKGYGEITRKTAADGSTSIIKRVMLPKVDDEPDNRSDDSMRKRISYQVERHLYIENPNGHVGLARIAKYIDSGTDFLEMEDLEKSFPVTKSRPLDHESAKLVLRWLARFHGANFGSDGEDDPKGLRIIPAPNARENDLSHVVQDDIKESGRSKGFSYWKTGTYWYLDTRRAEARNLQTDDNPLKDWLNVLPDFINRKLKDIGADGMTLIHGDVKAAKVFFNAENTDVALYDFQYCGYSTPMRDVAAFLVTSVADINEQSLDVLLRYYHEHLITESGRVTKQYTYETMLEHYELCVVDFHRFMLSWGTWGNHRYAARVAKKWINERREELIDTFRNGW